MTDRAVTQAAFAEILGVRKSYVTQLKQSGRLVMDEAGKVLVNASQQRIAETADPAHAAVALRHAEARGSALPGSAVDHENNDKTDDQEPGEEAANPDYQRAKARKEEANASLAEMELAQRAGKLFEAAAVLSVVGDAAATFRQALEARRSLLAAQMQSVQSEAEMIQILAESDDMLLHDLAQRFSHIGKGVAA